MAKTIILREDDIRNRYADAMAHAAAGLVRAGIPQSDIDVLVSGGIPSLDSLQFRGAITANHLEVMLHIGRAMAYAAVLGL
jgi:hypothetical protein